MWATWVSERRDLVVGLGLLAAAALAIRAVDLEHIPANLGGDEGTWAIEGLAMWEGRLDNPFSTRWFSFPSMSFMAWGAAMQLFGETVGGVRALSALIGTVTVLTTFALARELWSTRIAWLAAALLTFSHYHLHFSRLAVNNIADGLLVTLALWALMKGLHLNQPGYFALAGAMVGAGWYGYFGARLLGLLVVAYAVWRWAIDREFLTRHGRSLVLMVATAIVVASPLLLHYCDHPETLAARSSQVNIISSGWLTREQEVTGRSAAGLLWQQVWKSISAFHYTLDPTFWYHPSIPLLDALSGILFVLGLMQAAAGNRTPAHSLILLWISLAVLFGWVLTENPPSSMRLVIVTPALALLCALGLDWLIRAGQRTLGQESRPFWTGVAITTLIAVGALNLHYYFTVYTPTRVYGNPTAEVTTRLARYLVQRDRRPVYFHGPPFIYWDFGTLRFLAHDVDGADVPPAGEGGVAARTDRGARFVFLPERISELEGVRQEFPGGRVLDSYSSADGRLLYTIYEVDPPPTSDQPSSYSGGDVRSEETRES
jgi:hypothetical protein